MNGDFTEETKRTLAKRAGEKCSLCGIGTSKPHSDAENFVNLGEAAHIRGNKKDKFNRFDASMTDAERSNIVNGLWLCRTCHKKIDRDDKKYSVTFLTTTKENHEHIVDIGFFDQKNPDHELQQKIQHDKNVFNLSQEVFNETQLKSFLVNLAMQKFVFLEDEGLKKLNNYLEFHNFESNRYLFDELNSLFSNLLHSINVLLIKLYSVEEKYEKNDILFHYQLPSCFIIGMQPPLKFKFSFLDHSHSYFSYQNKFNHYTLQLDRDIESVKSTYSEYRQLIKKTLYV